VFIFDSPLPSLRDQRASGLPLSFPSVNLAPRRDVRRALAEPRQIEAQAVVIDLAKRACLNRKIAMQ
jgi:hypothetical protein